ncbi:hypothetical protein Salat_1776300 [Sesamum alatum]|uniref:CW-type domain-containing protein n=1 Tax=Sesamum alatum TaxID=300844 RepID=A0AAE2CKU5_9LAMI|nr:hypothetical protein Salat_1776300 [Sesamum alatum]
MIQEPELEEGETCYYKDDRSIDPDIALPYFGDKVQRILGHLQKDFEGGISEENLGAKFGGYGSFLPMYQRSPSIWSQPKSPQRVQNHNLSRSPDHVCPEGPAPNSVMVPDAPSAQRNGSSSSPSFCASQTLKISSEDASIRQRATLPANKVAEALPGKVELPSSKSGNLPDQRTLRVRIKVGPDRVAKYNAEIYNLGLTSPSSSEGNSHDESDGLFESHETPMDSPADILQIMTSFPVSGGLLLSPLCEDLLKLARETEDSVETEFEAASKSSRISVRLSNNDGFGQKKTNFVDKSRNFEISEDEFKVDKKKSLSSSNLDCSVQPVSDGGREREKSAQVKKRRGSKDRVKGKSVSGDSGKDAFLEHTSDQSYVKYDQPEPRFSSLEKVWEHQAIISQKDVLVDHQQDNRSRGERNRASLRAYSGNSEDERVKGALDNSGSKVGPDATSSKHNGFGTPHAVNRLSFEGDKKSKGSQSSKLASKSDRLKDGGCAGPENKSSGKKDVHTLQLGQKDAGHTSFAHMENPKHLLERPSGDKPKKFNLDAAKAKSAYAGKLKERSSNKKYLDKVISDMTSTEPPAPAIHSKEGISSGLEQTVAAPVVIQEDWVGCDRCQKWRLLPYGTKSEQLPDKWVCSMLDWLPGMNRCDISEDQTTKALQALYLVPVPENQQNFQAGTMAGVISVGAHHLDQNYQNCASDQIMLQKLKKKQNEVSMTDPVPSSGKKNLQRLAVKNGSSKEIKQSLAGVSETNKLGMQHPNKSAVVVPKSSKRKSEHVIGDDANPRKKIKNESAQHEHGKVKKIKSKGALNVDNFQISGGNLGMIGNSLTSGLLNKGVLKDEKRKSAGKEVISGDAGNFQIHVKKQKDQMQVLPDGGHLDVKTCNGRELSTKKIKLKDYGDSQYQGNTRQNDGNTIQDRKVSTKEDKKVGDLHRDKRSQVSQVEERDSKRSKLDDIPKRKSIEAGVHSAGSKECPVNRDIEKEQVTKSRAKRRLTIEDIDKLRKDLGCEQLSTAATSSSSKVSDSRKNRISSYMEMKGSPEESVSSSPIRMPYTNQVSPRMMVTVGKVDSRLHDVPATGSLKKIRGMNGSSELGIVRNGSSGLTNDNGSEILDSKNKLKGTAFGDNHCAPKHEVSSNRGHPFSDESSIKSVKNGTSSKRDIGKSGDSKSENPSAQGEQISSHTEPWSGKLRIDLRQGDKQGELCHSKHTSGSLASSKKGLMDARALDASVVGDTSKALKDTAIARLQNGTHHFFNNEAARSLAQDATLGNKNVPGVTASAALKEAEDVLKEAEELRIHADLIKNSGFSSESNYEYFKAALKFLHGASLLEACNGEGSKHLGMSPMQMYGTAAKLCKTCAYEFEKGHEMGAAALAYKCVEVAYLRVVYCKSSTTNRVWHDLQSSLQMVPQGESPSSSASDVDNLNNLAAADKATLSKGSGSHAGNHVLVPRNRPNFVRLLDFTKDVNSAMEAAKKSQDMFAAARVELEKSENKEAIVSVKRVIDFSFQNVEELVRLVWLAFNTINHQGPSGGRE